MPRSAKATSRASVSSSKRVSKRNASKQRDVYAIPESPQASTASENENTSRCDTDVDSSLSNISSPTLSLRGRSMSTASTKVSEENETTPTQVKPSRAIEPCNSKRLPLPGFEALEAVNGLYQKLNDSQTEIERLHRENETLTQEMQKCQSQVRSLQIDLQDEREKVKRAQRLCDKENEGPRRVAEDKLSQVFSSLQAFSSAAYNLMPLLDVLSNAPDIEYDEATEKLYEIMKEHKEKSRDHKSTISGHKIEDKSGLDCLKPS